MDADVYVLMDERAVTDYVRRKTDFFPAGCHLEAKEIGDGNLNYVFRVTDGDKSVIVKQAGSMGRLSPDRKLSRDRNRIESEILLLQGELAPGFVPQVYLYDEIMHCCIMEDLRDYEIMRTGLTEGGIYPDFAGHMAEFLVNMLMKTSDLSKDHKRKKGLVKAFINPDLCEISERLVFDEAAANRSGKNQVEPENEEFVQKLVYENDSLRLEAAKLKFRFMNCGQTLIHGDLHTGSIFVREHDTRIFDPEFAFYGPAGYDLGNVAGNMLMAYVRAVSDGRKGHRDWLSGAVMDVIGSYVQKYEELYPRYADDLLAAAPGFKEWYLKRILEDTAGYAGMEIIRRTVGIAKVKDITGIPDGQERARAQRRLIQAGIRLVLERSSFTGAEAYGQLAADIIQFQ